MGNSISGVLRDVAELCDSKGAEGQDSVQRNQRDTQQMFDTSGESGMWSARVPIRLQAGDVIELEGAVADDANTFVLNLSCDPDGYVGNPQSSLCYVEIDLDSGEGTTRHIVHGEHLNVAPLQVHSLERGADFTIRLVLEEDKAHLYVHGKDNMNGAHTYEYPEQDLLYDNVSRVQVLKGLARMNAFRVNFANRDL